MKKLILFLLVIMFAVPVYADFPLKCEEGDIGVWVVPECEYGTPCFISQKALVAGEAEADSMGLTTPFIGVPIKSWDFQKNILDTKQYVMHIQPLSENMILTGQLDWHGATLVVLRFKPDNIKENASGDWPITLGENTPRPISDFPRMVIENINVIRSYIRNDPSRYYVPYVDVALLFSGLITSEQYLPMKGLDQKDTEYLNILNGNAFFSKRRYNCGTALFWSMWQALMQLGATSTNILDSDWVKAADSISPGQIAQWLTGRGWVKLVSIEMIP